MGAPKGHSVSAFASTLSKMPGWASTSSGEASIDPTDIKDRKRSGSLHAPLKNAFRKGYCGSSGTYSPVSRSDSISASRLRSSSTVARYHGSASVIAAASNASANAWGSPVPVSARTRRRHNAWSNPIVMPRPTDGLVHAHESATTATPVATGVSSTTRRFGQGGSP